MFFIFGWGKLTKKIVGPMFERTCNYCNNTSIWQLSKDRTWFTLFFIPVIPYKTRYSISCPHCGSYLQITAEQFAAMKADLSANHLNSAAALDKLKYAGKTDVQINYLKQMEEFNAKK